MYTKLSTTLALAIGLGFVSSAQLRAQQPTKLPAVVIKAPVEKPGPKAVAGVARDTFAIGIDSVEISIPSLQRRVFTDANGKFRLNDIRGGKYTVRARKIGYAPALEEVVVDDSGAVATFDLLELHRSLPPMIVSAARGGLSGVVGDTAYHAIIGADVKLLGEGRLTQTDVGGKFFFAVKPGDYTLSVHGAGFTDRMVTVHVPDDSGKRVSLMLNPAGPRADWLAGSMAMMGERLAFRNKQRSTVYSHDKMVSMGAEWVEELMQGAVTRAGSSLVVAHGCTAVLNGGPQTVNVGALTVDDVESVEVYPNGGNGGAPAAAAKRIGSRASRPTSLGPGLEIREYPAMRANAGLGCPLTYVWTR